MTPAPDQTTGAAAPVGRAALLLPFAVGAGVRLYRLPAQILTDDEVHALEAMFLLPIPELLVTYRQADHCIPLTVLYRLLADAGVALGEIHLRAPALLAGLVLIALAPRLLARRLGAAATIAFAWLLALSPFLVFYSRIARPYLPVALLGLLAALAFERWWRTRAGADAAAYACLGALTVYFHPLAGPFVAAPLAYALGCIALGRAGGAPRGPALARLAGVAAGLAAALALFLVPARHSLAELAGTKAGVAAPHLLHVDTLLASQAGTGRWPLVALFFLAAAFGLASLFRSRPRFATYTAVLVAGHVLGVALVSPLVAYRYLLVASPIVLVWVAVGLTRAWWPAAGPGARRAQRALAVAFVAALAWTGPLSNPALRFTSFAHHPAFLAVGQPFPEADDALLPAVYRRLPKGSGGALLEYPWGYTWWASIGAFHYQLAHRREVLVSTPVAFLNEPRLALRNLVHPTPEDFLASRAHTLVVHEDLHAEQRRLSALRGRPSLPHWFGFERFFRRHGGEMRSTLEQRWGPPDDAEAGIAVWNLDRVRAALGAQGAPVSSGAAAGSGASACVSSGSGSGAARKRLRNASRLTGTYSARS